MSTFKRIYTGAAAPCFTSRPVIMGTHGIVTTSHYHASMAGLRMLEKGGNAVDASAAAGFAINVVDPHYGTIGGEVPILIYSAKEERVVAVSGQGPAPRAATIEWFKNRGIDVIPGDGLLPATVPDMVAAWITALTHFGKLRLADILEPSILLAEDGFPVYFELWEAISASAEKFLREWPTTAKVFLPDGKVPSVGDVLGQLDLAKTFRMLVEAEDKASHDGRAAGLEAARDAFYAGEIAEKIVDFARNTEVLDASGRRNRGLIDREDLQRYRAKLEEPVSTIFRGYDVFKCGPWSQGPVFLEQLNLLESYDLKALGHNSPDYIHLLVEAAKLAFADREAYYGDPDFDHVPLNMLLTKDYAERRRELIDPSKASLELRPGKIESPSPSTSTNVQRDGGSTPHGHDTVHIDAIDREGNMVSATPSGGFLADSPIIEGLGFPLGTRAQMFYLERERPNCLQPGKRPRTTLSPSLTLKNGRPFMVFGTAGADMQDQWTLQFFLNVVEFEMNLQQAIDAPHFHSLHFPSSFYPRTAYPGRVVVEGRIPETVLAELRRRGHDVQVGGVWGNSQVLAASIDIARGVLQGGASPRRSTGYAVGW